MTKNDSTLETFARMLLDQDLFRKYLGMASLVLSKTDIINVITRAVEMYYDEQ